jgi:DNA-binding TFAR19-related protein (PDSD5 family)
MASSGMLRRVALVRTDVSEELSASIIRVTRIGELETKIDVTSNRRTLRRNTKYLVFLGIASCRLCCS